MDSATAAGHALHVNWSHWCHCESSFDLMLVPEAPGLFAVSRKGGSDRELTIVRVEATDNLFQALNGLFSPDSPLREEFTRDRYFLRIAVVDDSTQRQGAAKMLQDWIAGRVPAGTKPGLIEEFLATDSFASR